MMVTGNKERSGADKRDLRVIRTHDALFAVMLDMLGQKNFNDITVNNLCSNASISRATFYSHFNDKYDLLRYMLAEIRESIVNAVGCYEDLEMEVNGFVSENKKLIMNILRDANSETQAIVRDVMSVVVERIVTRKVSDDECLQHVILFNFIIGGLVNHLTWMMNSGFPAEVNMMNTYVYNLLKATSLWDSEQ